MAIYDVNANAINLAYHINETELDYAYDINGEQVYSKYVPQLTLLNTMLMSTLNSSITITPQGFAVYGDYYFQFFTGDNKMRIFNKTTFALVAEYSATDIKHANTMQFGTVIQDTGFPFLYVSEWGDSGQSSSRTIDVLKVSLSGYQKITSHTLPSSCGNFPSLCFDWVNERAYSVGYENGTADSDHMIITYFDINDLTTPILQYQVPYMGVLNAWKYYNGKLIFYGNGWDSASLLLSMIDISTHNVIQYTFEKAIDEEYEDCDIDGTILLLSNWLRTNNVLYYRIFSMNLPQ